MALFLKFFRIISAVILFKLSGYALMVVLFLHKIEIPWHMKSIGVALLGANIYFIWQSFRLQDKFPWGLIFAGVNLSVIGWGLSRGLV